jgi:hypothetical protein
MESIQPSVLLWFDLHESSKRIVADRERAVAVRARVEGGKGVFGSNSKWEYRA